MFRNPNVPDPYLIFVLFGTPPYFLACKKYAKKYVNLRHIVISITSRSRSDFGESVSQSVRVQRDLADVTLVSEDAF